MKTILTTQVGADGVLTLTVPLGKDRANKLVRVLVEPVTDATSPAAPIRDGDEWLHFLHRTGGAIADPTFERPEQGGHQERDSMS